MSAANQFIGGEQGSGRSRTLITWIFACAVTATAMGMAAVAGWDRGGTGVDRALLVALSLIVCLGTHLIPALSRRRVAWLLWAGCLLGTVYGHVTFFVNAEIRAGAARAQTSIQVAGTEKQLDAIHEALAETSSHPVAVVAAELYHARSWRRRQALKAELGEAERAAHLRDEIIRLSATAANARVTAAENPVIGKVIGVTGGNAANTELLIASGFSILLELLGALLWWEALRRPQDVQRDASSPPVTHDPIAALQEALGSGRCKSTVAGIREFMGCGQARAMELRRQLVGSVANNE